ALGLALSIPTWLILLSSAYWIGFLIIMLFFLIRSCRKQSAIIVGLYYVLDYCNEYINPTSMLSNSGILSSLYDYLIDLCETNMHKKGLSGFLSKFGLIMMSITLAIIPLIAVLFAFYKMIILFGWAWWI